MFLLNELSLGVQWLSEVDIGLIWFLEIGKTGWVALIDERTVAIRCD